MIIIKYTVEPLELIFLGWGEQVPSLKNDDTLLGRSGGMPVKFFNFVSLKRHFLHFKGTFEQNIKVLNHIFNSVSKGINC